MDNFTEQLGTNVSGIGDNITNSDTPTFDVHVYPGIKLTELVCLIIITIIGVPGNGLIILVQLRNGFQSTTDHLIFTLAIWDFICASTNTTLHIIRNLWLEKVMNTAYCRTFLVMGNITITSSCYVVAVIAIDRYILTCKPFNRCYTPRIAKRACIFVSLAGILISLPMFLSYEVKTKWICTPISWLQTLYKVWLVVFSSSIFCAIGIIILCYIHIGAAMRKRYAMFRQSIRANKGVVDSCNTNIVQDHGSIYSISVDHTDISTLGDSIDLKTDIGHVVQKSRSTKLNKDELSSKTLKQNTPDILVEDGIAIEFPAHSTHTYGTEGLRRNSISQPEQQVDNKKTSKAISSKRLEEQAAFNRMTVMMTIVSAVSILTWSFGFGRFAIGVPQERMVVEMGYTPIMFNSITNPICCITLSSKFRETAKQILLALWCKNPKTSRY